MTSFALNNLWAYLQGLSLSQADREWLTNKLIMHKETNLVTDDNARLDEALKKFSGDFGGPADAIAVAEELRQGRKVYWKSPLSFIYSTIGFTLQIYCLF